MRLRGMTLLVLVAVFGFAGCGSTTSPGEPVTAAVRAFLEACSARDYPAATEALTPADRRALIAAGTGLDGCRRILRGLVPPGAGDRTAQLIIARAQPVATDIGGDSATARVSSGPHSAKLELEYARNSWWIAAPAG
ncbi:MAG TPA: hypothetical protein VFN40_11665 [Gemmatimonadales bacterium]|nr:hypothetical protein [Gemmatimonadales bacterium]